MVDADSWRGRVQTITPPEGESNDLPTERAAQEPTWPAALIATSRRPPQPEPADRAEMPDTQCGPGGGWPCSRRASPRRIRMRVIEARAPAPSATLPFSVHPERCGFPTPL